jgi:DNA sulfur modification protein DndC
MESMVDNGEEWMQPLLDFRDELATHHKPEVKRQLRSYKRRDGKVSRKADGSLKSPGPYRLQVRQDLLRKLLQVQQAVRREGPDPNATLISLDELQEIRRIWRTEEQDWEDSLPRIYHEVIGDELECVKDDVTNFTIRDQELLFDVARKHGVHGHLVAKLLDIERELHGMSRRAGIYERIGAVLGEDWLDNEEARQLFEMEDEEATA